MLVSRFIRNIFYNTAGITSIEYALIAAVISVSAFAAMGSIGESVNTMFDAILVGLNR
ncbi:MAG: Flp family type IVb pilin [Erythrobacter sp.]|jgi:Flp pilus assembly pilin Flp|uniref:Flp family type IVb pilin n=1 Tax=Erythrobacter sp. TaxID=1042 RepID=UPI002B47520C|nr:Flp family type IVb pilin [Erythrobacter sp.]WRH70170.1 MAG: Flp family type IVb pilin [Erythrobacter sp.]